MKALHGFFVVFCLFNLNIAKGQEQITDAEIQLRCYLKFEALIDGESSLGDTGVYFTMDISEDKSGVLYSVILIKKSAIKNATEIRLYFKKTDGSKPYMMTIPNNSTYVIESDENSDLAAITFGQLRSEYNLQKNLVEPIFYTEDFLSELYPGSQEKDLLEIKKVMRTPIPKNKPSRYIIKKPPR